MSESIKKQTFSGIKWTALEQLSTHVVTFVLGIILARLLSPSDFGTVGVLSVFMAVSQTFIDSGFGQALIRQKKLNDVDCSTVFYFNIAVSLVCYLILFLCAPLIADFFAMPILSSIVKVYCLTLLIGSFESVQISRLTANLNFKALAKVNVLSSLVSCVVGVSLAYLNYGVWVLVWQRIVARLFHLCMVWIVAKWHPQWTFSKQSFMSLFSFGGKLLVGNLIWQIYVNLTPIIIGKYFSAKDLGYYTRGTHLATLPANTIMGVLSKVTYPILAKIQDDRVRLVSIYRKYIKSTSMAIMFALLLLAALAKPVVLLLLTDKWADCIIYLQIFIFSAMFDHVDKLNLNLLKVVGKSDLILKLEIYKRIISLSVLFAAIPFGVIGICISKVIYGQIALAFNTYYSGKLFGMGYFSQMKDFVPYAFFSFISCVPAYCLTMVEIPYWTMIAAGFIIAVGVYWSILHLLNDSSYRMFVVPALNKIKSKWI